MSVEQKEQEDIMQTPATSSDSLRNSMTETEKTLYITPESVADFTLATMIATGLGFLTVGLDLAGYEVHHLIEGDRIEMRKVSDDAFIPEIGALVFGIGAWFVFLSRGLGKRAAASGRTQ